MKNAEPSIKYLNYFLNKENILQFSGEYLILLLRILGYLDAETSSKVIIKREYFVTRRLRYLQAMQQYRTQEKSIFFINFMNCWDDYEDPHYRTPRPIIIVVHFSGTIGFTDSQIMKFISTTAKPIERLR